MKNIGKIFRHLPSVDKALQGGQIPLLPKKTEQFIELEFDSEQAALIVESISVSNARLRQQNNNLVESNMKLTEEVAKLTTDNINLKCEMDKLMQQQVEKHVIKINQEILSNGKD